MPFKPAKADHLGDIPYPLAILSVCGDAHTHSLTVAWATQISRDPMRFMVCVGKNRHTHEILDFWGGCSLALSYISQPHTAVHFGRQSGRDVDKWALFSKKERLGGCWVPADAKLVITGKRGTSHDFGSHTGIIIEVSKMYRNTEVGKIINHSDLLKI